jgi:hypothetical protein
MENAITPADVVIVEAETAEKETKEGKNKNTSGYYTKKEYVVGDPVITDILNILGVDIL